MLASRNMPRTAVAAIASSTPATNEPVSCTNVEARNAPSIYSEPCARLIMSMMPNTSVRPAASRNSMRPNWTPFSPCSKKRIADINWGLTPINALLHAAFAQPVVLVVLQDSGDLFVDDATLAVLHQGAHVVVLDRGAVRRLLPRAARRFRALGRLHQSGAESLRILDLALRVLHRLVDDQRRGVSLLRVQRGNALVLLLEFLDELAVGVVIQIVGPLRRIEEPEHRLADGAHHVLIGGEARHDQLDLVGQPGGDELLDEVDAHAAGQECV